MSAVPRIILASGSAIRRQILTEAGVPFEVMKPDVDEDVIKQAAKTEGVDLEPLAMRLAEAKCMDIAARLLETQGAAHTLINAIAVARDGQIIWRNLDRPTLVMRSLSAREIDAYLKTADPDILHSVGAYQIEQLGSRLFERIDGDHFAVLGLSLFPLLDLLRREGALAF